MDAARFSLVRLAGGHCAVHAQEYGEAMHPGLGPAAEAEALYVSQLRRCGGLRHRSGEFVLWDVGLGAAANVLTALHATQGFAGRFRVVSFDNTLEPLAFALEHAQALGYFHGYEPVVGRLLRERVAEFPEGGRSVQWQVIVDDLPRWAASPAAAHAPKPDAIFFDAFSPAKNPAMWTLPLFERLYALLDPRRPCVLATYSRSTMVRVALLLAGFFVGRGRGSGPKEETTVAANRLECLEEPLGAEWLRRAKRSGGAEPLREASYRQAPLSDQSWARLQAHPQFVIGRTATGESSPQPAFPNLRQ